MKHATSFALAALLLAACNKPTADEQALPKGVSASGDARVLATPTFFGGALASAAIVAPNQLCALGGTLVGPRIWKSNNPEAVTGEGWLMTSGNNAPQRGGTAAPVSGSIALYVSHLNFTGAKNQFGQPTTRRNMTIHLIATNPSSSTITITGQGKIAANNQWRFRTANPAVKSAWYLSSEAWATNSLDNVSVSILPGKAAEIARAFLPAGSGDVTTTEGRYEVNVNGGTAFFTSVATFDGSVARAVGFASGSTAQMAPGNEGSPLVTTDPASSAYGREAGIAINSAFYSGDVNLTLPTNGPAHLGLCYNTNNHLSAPGTNIMFEDQSAPYSMRLRSSFRTWAGYGQKFNAKLVLRNPGNAAQTVRVSLGANDIGNTNEVLFDAPVQVATAGGTAVRQVILYNRLGAQKANGPQRRPLTTVSVPANGSTTVNVICYVPGLGFGAGLQLVVESGI